MTSPRPPSDKTAKSIPIPSKTSFMTKPRPMHQFWANQALSADMESLLWGNLVRGVGEALLV